jgi:hypothetical protein
MRLKRSSCGLSTSPDAASKARRRASSGPVGKLSLPCKRNSGSVGTGTADSPDSDPDKGPARSSMAWMVLRRVRRCPPGVFHDAIAPLSIHN